jgi:hypothetical protein
LPPHAPPTYIIGCSERHIGNQPVSRHEIAMLTAKEVLKLAALLLVDGLFADSALACSYVNEAAARANSVGPSPPRRNRFIRCPASYRQLALF